MYKKRKLFCEISPLTYKISVGNVEPSLQDNKAINLSLASPKVSGVIIKPGQIFSFWKLVGPCTIEEGYKEGLVISNGKTAKGIGGGMC